MKRLEGMGLAVFCLWAGSRWLVENAFPSSLPPLAQQSFHSLVLGFIALGFWFVRGRPRLQNWPRLALASVLLLGLPALLNAMAGEVVAQAGAALFTLVPLFVVVGAAAMDAGSGGRAAMLPALVGLAGGLLLLPFQLPSTAYGGFQLGLVLAAVMLTAVGSVWMHRLLASAGMAAAVGVGCGANAVLLGVASGLLERSPVSPSLLPTELLRCVALDLPLMFLLVWLLRALAPAQVAVRYLLVPLVTVIEGAVFVRPAFGLRMVLGVILMLVGGGALLFLDSGGEDDLPSLLGLR